MPVAEPGNQTRAKREVLGGQTNAMQYVWDRWELVAVLAALAAHLEPATAPHPARGAGGGVCRLARG